MLNNLITGAVLCFDFNKFWSSPFMCYVQFAVAVIISIGIAINVYKSGKNKD